MSLKPFSNLLQISFVYAFKIKSIMSGISDIYIM